MWPVVADAVAVIHSRHLLIASMDGIGAISVRPCYLRGLIFYMLRTCPSLDRSSSKTSIRMCGVPCFLLLLLPLPLLLLPRLAMVHTSRQGVHPIGYLEHELEASRCMQLEKTQMADRGPAGAMDQRPGSLDAQLMVIRPRTARDALPRAGGLLLGLDMPGAVLVPGRDCIQIRGGTAVEHCHLATRVESVVFGGGREHVCLAESWALWRAKVLPRRC